VNACFAAKHARLVAGLEKPLSLREGLGKVLMLLLLFRFCGPIKP